MTTVMKNSLFALLLLLAIVPLSAQKTLPNSVKTHAGTLDQKVTKAIELAGFDLHSSVTVKPASGVQQRSGELQLDSTKSFIGYDFVGTDDTLPFQRTIHQYPQSNFEIQTEAQFENGEWLTLSRSNISKDNQGRIAEIYSEAYDLEKGDFVPDSRALFYPHENDAALMDSFYVFGWDTLATDWALLFFTTNQYDGQDRLIESVSSFDYFGQQVLFKDVHTYDGNGDNILIESFALFGGTEIPSGKQELSYDDHQLVESIVYTEDALGTLTAQSRTTYTYTSFDNVEQVNIYQWSLAENDWVQTNGETYTYDNAQRLQATISVIYNQDGTEERDMTRYDYVADEKIASEAYYYWSVNQYVLGSRLFYYYSEGTLAGHEPNAAMLMLLSPNPTTGLARLNIESASMIQVFNTQGELVKSIANQSGNSVDISALPGGLYFVTAVSADGQYTGRLVKE